MYKPNDMKQFEGVYTLVLTPFKDDLSVDFKALEAYANYQASQKPQHLFAVCGSAEMNKLTLDERVEIASTVVKNAGNVPVVATANLEPSWYAQLEEIKRIEATGVSGLVFVTKGYGDDQERMFTYLAELSSHSTLPIVLYEYPGTSPHKMTGETYAKLVETGHFVAIKDTTCTMPLIEEKIKIQGKTSVLQANIPYLYDSYVAGARGACATTTTCGTHLFVKMWSEFCKGERDKAKITHQHICLLDNALTGGFSATAKYLLNLQGIKMNHNTRDGKVLNAQRLRALEVWYDWAKANEIMQ